MTRNTHTTKKYAIDLIQEIRDRALDKIKAVEEPCLERYKLEAVKKGKASFLFTHVIRLAKKSVKENRYGSPCIEVAAFTEVPEAYTKALGRYEADQPRVTKKKAVIDKAYEVAERAVMLGGSDNVIAKAIAKLESLIG